MAPLTPEGSDTVRLLTFTESWDARLTLPEAVAEPGQDFYEVWIPIMWEDGVGHSIEDADDWKDDVIPAASQSEAEAIATLAFGSAEERGWVVQAA